MAISKPMKLDRRTFLRRAGLLVSSLGVGVSAQAGLMDTLFKRARRRFGGDAIAATTSGPVRLCIEITCRAGFQMNALFPSMGHTSASRSPILNVYSSAGAIQTVAPTGGMTQPLYLAPYGTSVGAQLLAPFAGQIAVSEAINLSNGHTADWTMRAPQPMCPAPSVLHALAKPAALAGDVRMAEINPFASDITNPGNGLVTHRTGGKTIAISTVQNRSQFVSLYKNQPMYFSTAELKEIVGVVQDGAVVNGQDGSLGSFDQLFAVRNVPGTDEVLQVSLSGRGQAQLDKLSQLLIAGCDPSNLGTPNPANSSLDAKIVSNFGGATEMNRAQPTFGGAINEPIGRTLAGILKAYLAGALTSAVVVIDSSDWHSNDQATDLDDANGKQGQFNIWLGNALAGFLKTVNDASIPDPFVPTQKIGDSFFLMMSSEFTRTPTRTDPGQGNANSNNNDGGTQAVMMAGSGVRGGTYGNIDPTGAVVAFDPSSGAIASGAPLVTESVMWKTAGQLIGVDAATLDAMLALPTAVSAATALIR